MKIQKSHIIILLLIVALFLVGYIVSDNYEERQEEKFKNTSEEYYLRGYQDTINQLISEAKQCKQIPLDFEENNITQRVTLVALECLNG